MEQAIAEKKAKAVKSKDSSEPFGNVQPEAEIVEKIKQPMDDESRVTELERENLDLEVTNRAKGVVIDRMQKEREGFVDQLLAANRKVGELETSLPQIESPVKNWMGVIPHSEGLPDRVGWLQR